MTFRTPTGATLLVVDDTPANLGILMEALETEGYRVVVAQDGEEGLERAAFVKPDLILLDVMMPGIDGFEVCRRLRQDNDTAEIPVIFMTALSDTWHKVTGFETGGVDYVTKPIQIEELLVRIGVHLKLKAMQRQLQEQNLQLQAYQDELELRVAERTAQLGASNRLLREEIEERKQTQQQLALLDFALNQVGEAAYLIDERGRFHYVNDEACKVLGYPRDSLLAMAVYDIDPVLSETAWRSSWQDAKCLANETMESRHRCRDGRTFPVEISASYFEYQGASYKLALVRDISERKGQEAQLLASECKFRTLAENSPDVLGRLDNECRYLYANSQLQAIIGRPEAEIVGKTPRELLDEPYIGDYQDKIVEVLQTAEAAEMVIVSPPREDLRKLHDHVRFVPEFDEAGKVASVLIMGRDISQFKEIERQLRTLVENIPDFVVRLDRQGRHLYVSPTVLQAFAMREEQFLGRTVVEVGVTGDAGNDELLLETALRCAREGKPNRIELMIQRAHCSIVNSITHVPEFNEFGEVETVLGVGNDISEHYRMEQELIRRENEFRTLAENSPDAIVRYDCDGRRIYFNRAYIEAVGSEARRALGKTPLEFWPMVSPAAEEYIERLQRTLESGEPDQLLTEVTGSEGLPAYRNMFLVPEFDEAGKPLSVLSISHDVTGIKRMEAMLRKSEMEFRTLAENSPDIIVRYDRDCRRVYLNPAYERETGIPLEDAWFKTPFEVLKPAISAAEYTARLQRVMATGQAERMLLEWQDGDGKPVIYDMHAVAEYGENGQISGVLVIGHNVTELKNSERHLEESRRQLRLLTAKREEGREEERKRIAREIHDELGQLLNVLRLSATTLDFRFGETNPDLHDKTQKMVATIDRAILMVRNLATRLRPAVLNAGIVPALDWLVKEYAESTGIACRLHVLSGEVALDEDRAMVVFRIVQESLTNVLRHAEASCIDVFIRSGSGVCEVEVRDNGKGFDPERAGRSDSYGIVGMQERALILKGGLEISAVEGIGSRVKLHFPVS